MSDYRNKNVYTPLTVVLSGFKRLNLFFKQLNTTGDLSLGNNLYGAAQEKKTKTAAELELLNDLPPKRTLEVVSFQREL